MLVVACVADIYQPPYYVSIPFRNLLLHLVLKLTLNVLTFETQPPARYDFSYNVREPLYSVDMGHKEYRNGDNTRGEYSVVLPDGRRQIVTYYVNGDSGYVAEVKYF